MGKENPNWDKFDAKFVAEYAGLVIAGSILSLGEYAVKKMRQHVPFLPNPKEKPLDTSSYRLGDNGQLEHVSSDGEVLRRFVKK